MLKIRFIFIVLLIFMIIPLNAEELGDSAVWKGVYAFYNNETEEAVKILTQARKEFPLNPAVHFTLSSARWLHSQANDPINETYDVLNRDLDVLIPLYEELVDEYHRKH